MKILVADKITAYHAYVDAHARLFTATDHDSIFAAARDTVENYLENRHIHDELTHYQKTGQILGKHPIFSKLRRIDQIRGMKIGEPVKLKMRLENNLVRNRKSLREEKDNPENNKRAERISQMQLELTEVNRLLNIDE